MEDEKTCPSHSIGALLSNIAQVTVSILELTVSIELLY